MRGMPNNVPFFKTADLKIFQFRLHQVSVCILKVKLKNCVYIINFFRVVISVTGQNVMRLKAPLRPRANSPRQLRFCWVLAGG